MNYDFLINNEYHYSLACNFIKNEGVKAEDVKFILIKHVFNNSKVKMKTEEYNCIPRLIESKLDYINVFKHFSLRQKIGKLKFSEKSILFIFTEFELVNCAIVKAARKQGARIVLVEDGGIASYIQFVLKGNRNSFRFIIPKLILQITEVKETRIDNYLHSRMPDRYFDSLVYSLPLKHSRDIKTLISNSFYNTDELVGECRENGAMYINQDLYHSYMDFDEYLKSTIHVIRDIINECSGKSIIFRFHPRDNKRQTIELVLSKEFDALEFDYGDLIIEDVIISKGISKVYGYNSSALFLLGKRGINVNYVNIKFPMNNSSTLAAISNEVISEMDVALNNEVNTGNVLSSLKMIWRER